MGNLALRVEGLGKLYRIAGRVNSYRTLRDSLTDAMTAPFKRARSLIRGEAYGASGLQEEIWALKDVSFEVEHGEVVGIIGRNGAGKSTLLKILSRITDPTEGYAEVYGRVGSLLEVGTGFHPELTGRENIYLNGAILGMSRAEIDRKFDEIVDFAEIEKFIDTPVKHYSSGMGLRLGFAVAAHLEPEILIVDEVLAVGDAEFQKKCLGKMSDVAGEGRTVLFVSHNMAAVATLCTEGLWLHDGKVCASGEINDLIHKYLGSLANSAAYGVADLQPEPDLPFFVKTVTTMDVEQNVKNVFSRSEPIVLRMSGEVRDASNEYVIALDVYNYEGVLLFRTHDIESSAVNPRRVQGAFEVTCTLPSNLLPASTYRIGVITAILGKKELQRHYPVLQFDVVQEEALARVFFGTRGLLTPSCAWRIAGNAH